MITGFYIILFSFFLAWIYFYSRTILYFTYKKITNHDLIFSSREKSFDSISVKLSFLEGIIKKDLSFYKKQVAFYQNNAKRTRRKYHHFSHLIEPAILNLYLSSIIDLSKSKKRKLLYKNLDIPYQHFFTFLVYSIIILFLIVIIGSFFTKDVFIGAVSLLMFPLIVVLGVSIIYINFLFVDLLSQIILKIKRRDNGAVNRNFLIVSRMFMSISSNKNSNIGFVIAGTGVAMSGGSFGGGGFGGFGGGSFGGGGAGGSW